MTCPMCGAQAGKVIYLGLPMRLCACSCLFGFWAGVIEWLPLATADGEFAFMAYTGSYPRALLHWLVGNDGSQ
jgi:hypothetical protein